MCPLYECIYRLRTFEYTYIPIYEVLPVDVYLVPTAYVRGQVQDHPPPEDLKKRKKKEKKKGGLFNTPEYYVSKWVRQAQIHSGK